MTDDEPLALGPGIRWRDLLLLGLLMGGAGARAGFAEDRLPAARAALAPVGAALGGPRLIEPPLWFFTHAALPLPGAVARVAPARARHRARHGRVGGDRARPGRSLGVGDRRPPRPRADPAVRRLLLDLRPGQAADAPDLPWGAARGPLDLPAAHVLIERDGSVRADEAPPQLPDARLVDLAEGRLESALRDRWSWAAPSGTRRSPPSRWRR